MSGSTKIGDSAASGLSSLPLTLLQAAKRAYWRLVVAPMLPPGEPPARLITPRFLLSALLFIVAMMVWRGIRVYPTGVFDFYPLYYGGRAWRETGNAYALDLIIPPDSRNFQLFQIGNVYPFTAVLIALPFSFPPPQVAAVLWVGFLSLGLVTLLRLLGWPFWYVLYLPFVEGIRIEQYTIFITLAQMLGIWAWRERRPWLVAFCCTLMMTKPNHALLFMVALLFQTRAWRQFLIVALPFFALSVVLQPTWIVEWIGRLQYSHAVLQQPFYWPLALLALPLLLIGDLIGGVLILQFAMLPFPGSYSASAVPFSVLGDRRSLWLMPIAVLWMPIAAFVGPAWATGLTLLLPVVLLSLWRWWEPQQAAVVQGGATDGDQPATTTGWPFGWARRAKWQDGHGD